MKKYRQQLAGAHEEEFRAFCKTQGVACINLDKSQEARMIYLKEASGKSPDFLCEKDGKHIFVEVKTHTLFTNAKREKVMKETITFLT